MKLGKLTPTLSVSDQLTVDDVAALAAMGVKAIICNRPDGEAPDQPTSAEIEAAAHASGLTYRHIPVVGGQIDDEQIELFGRTLAALDGPTIAYCRSGTRSATLWALSEAGRTETGAILKAAQSAGYDLTSLEPRLTTRANGSGGTTPDVRENHHAA